MQVAYGWANLPRTLVHNNAIYMVTAAHERLNVTLAGALQEAGFTSWAGGIHDSTAWLVETCG